MIRNEKIHAKMSAFRIDYRATVIKHQWSPSADLFSGRNENENTSHKVETNDRDAVNDIHVKRQSRKAAKKPLHCYLGSQVLLLLRKMVCFFFPD